MKRKTLALLAVLALFLGGACSDDDEPAVEAGSDTTEQADDDAGGGGQGDKITITGKDRSFEVDSTLKGGFVEVEFKNEGKLKHEAGFVKVDKAYAQDEFVTAFKKVTQDQGSPIPADIHAYFGPAAELEGGKTQTFRQSLPAGDYFLVCTLTDGDSNEEEPEGGEEPPELPSHMEQGMITKVKVTGPSTAPPPAGAETTVTAKDYTFDVKGLTAGKKKAVFVNDPSSKEIHMAVIMEFAEGVDEAAAKKAVEAFSGDGPPPAGTPEPEEAGFSGVFDPGGGSEFELDVKANRVYAFLCFIQDRAGGPPHVAKGMVTLATAK